MTDLSDLIERVRAATGVDREVDGAIEVQARRFQAYSVGLTDATRAKWQHNGSTVFDGNTGYDAPHFTGSFDAALGLVERVLPGWEVLTRTGDPTTAEAAGLRQPQASLVPHLYNDAGWKAGRVENIPAHTLPLAIVLATLLALQAIGAE